MPGDVTPGNAEGGADVRFSKPNPLTPLVAHLGMTHCLSFERLCQAAINLFCNFARSFIRNSFEHQRDDGAPQVINKLMSDTSLIKFHLNMRIAA